jgi:hypothetical protein
MRAVAEQAQQVCAVALHRDVEHVDFVAGPSGNAAEQRDVALEPRHELCRPALVQLPPHDGVEAVGVAVADIESPDHGSAPVPVPQPGMRQAPSACRHALPPMPSDRPPTGHLQREVAAPGAALVEAARGREHEAVARLAIAPGSGLAVRQRFHALRAAAVVVVHRPAATLPGAVPARSESMLPAGARLGKLPQAASTSATHEAQRTGASFIRISWALGRSGAGTQAAGKSTSGAMPLASARWHQSQLPGELPPVAAERLHKAVSSPSRTS